MNIPRRNSQFLGFTQLLKNNDEEASMNSNTRGTARHTPGPWSVCPSTPSLIENERHDTIAQAHEIYDIRSTNESRCEKMWANARLIAAAPDMLAALQLVRFEFKEMLGEDRRSRIVRDRIDAAIAKAEGRS